MISRLTRVICKSENEYMQRCKAYVNKNGIKVLKLLSNWKFENYVVTERDLAIVLEQDFPLHPKLKKTDKLKQLARFFSVIGVELEYNKDGTISFYQSRIYNEIVKNHLKFTGKQITQNLANLCAFSNGRITYDALEKILGSHYPKAPYLHVEDRRWYMIFFFKHIGMLYNFDETEIYFP